MTKSKEPDQIIAQALKCLEKRLSYGSILLNSSRDVCAYLRLQLSSERNEVFAIAFLNNAHRLIAFEKLFQGTISETTVYPRTVVQKALNYNAAAVLLAHNHPSGACIPSQADRQTTYQLKEILKYMNIEVLDHIIVSNKVTYSFAEYGIL